MNTEPPSAYSGFNLETGDRVLFYIKVAIIALIFIPFGVGATSILALAACAAMGYEWYRLTTGGRDFDEPILGIALAAAALPPFAAFAVGLGGGLAIAALGVAFFLVMSPRKTEGICSAAAGLLLIGIAGACFVSLRDDPQHGLALVAWLIFVVVATEVGSGFIRDYMARDDGAHDPTADNTVPEICFSLVCGTLAGFIVAAFYRDGNIFWVVLASLLIAASVIAAGYATQRIKDWIGGSPSGSLFLGRGTVIENFDGLVFASIVATVMTFAAGVVFNW